MFYVFASRLSAENSQFVCKKVNSNEAKLPSEANLFNLK